MSEHRKLEELKIKFERKRKMDKSELKDSLMTYILEFVDLSDKKLVGILDKTFREKGLKNC